MVEVFKWRVVGLDEGESYPNDKGDESLLSVSLLLLLLGEELLLIEVVGEIGGVEGLLFVLLLLLLLLILWILLLLALEGMREEGEDLGLW